MLNESEFLEMESRILHISASTSRLVLTMLKFESTRLQIRSLVREILQRRKNIGAKSMERFREILKILRV